MFVMPALIGRAEFVRFFFGGEIWTFFRNLAYPLYLYSPIYALTYFLSLSNAQHLDYQMMFYNFCGIFVFTLIFGQIFTVLLERPFYAMLMFKHDLQAVTVNLNLNPGTAFNIEDYKIKEGEEQVLLLPPRKNDIFASEIGANLSSGRALEEKSTTMFDFSNSRSPGQSRQQ